MIYSTLSTLQTWYNPFKGIYTTIILGFPPWGGWSSHFSTSKLVNTGECSIVFPSYPPKSHIKQIRNRSHDHQLSTFSVDWMDNPTGNSRKPGLSPWKRGQDSCRILLSTMATMDEFQPEKMDFPTRTCSTHSKLTLSSFNIAIEHGHL